MKLSGGRRELEGARPAWRPIPAWAWMLTAVAAVVIVAFVVTTWLLTIAGGAKPGTDRANSRLDAVRTGLAAGAGAGAAVGLMLAFRRQHHQEIATVLTDLDATERRITELYTKAVEQLGSDKAPVRLGGLYALERLAQDNPAHRQTIVNVICAYLRMPFSLTAPSSKPEAKEEDLDEHVTETRPDAISDAWQQEKQVRLTAQHILAEHLRDNRPKGKRSTDPPGSRFWPNIRLDLAGATLIDFDLEDGVLADADFSGAIFSRGALFGGTTFSECPNFDGTTFNDGAWFRGAIFSDGALFGRATFGAGALFDGATFSDAVFQSATFSGIAGFDKASFSNRSTFDGASFSGFTGFRGASFNGSVEFDRATFSAGVSFGGATFSRDALFVGTTFSGGASFDGASLSRDASFDGATFSGAVTFGGASFNDDEGSLSFEQSRVTSPKAEQVWPPGWCLGQDGTGEYTIVRENGAGRTEVSGS
jgi:uncharacterized protein YjbI with pentapeptide repeats